MFRYKQLLDKIILATGGGMYLITFSNLELNWFLKGYAAIIPVQILALAYALYLIRDRHSA